MVSIHTPAVRPGVTRSGGSSTVTKRGYRERNEAEREWRGTLHPRALVEGPNARTAVRFDFVMQDGAFSVYAPTNALDDLANESVVIRGKLVDLGEADRRVEIWPGAIARIP